MWIVGIGVILLYNLFIFYIGYNIWVWLKTIRGEKRGLKYFFGPS